MSSSPDPIAEDLRRRRTEAGLTQRELAARSGVPQPNIAAYESGRRTPSTLTIDRLIRAIRTPTLTRLRAERDAILAAAERGMVEDVRVFGSVARGDADERSDVDLLVHPKPGASLIELAGFMAEVEELLGTSVDVVSDRSTGATMPHILKDAVPL